MRRTEQGCARQARPTPPPPGLSGRLLAVCPPLSGIVRFLSLFPTSPSVCGLGPGVSDRAPCPSAPLRLPGRGTHGYLCLAALGSRPPPPISQAAPAPLCSPFSPASPLVEPKLQGQSWACRQPIPQVLHGPPAHTCRPARVSPLLGAIHSHLTPSAPSPTSWVCALLLTCFVFLTPAALCK